MSIWSVGFCLSSTFVCSSSLICWIFKIKTANSPFPSQNYVLKDMSVPYSRQLQKTWGSDGIRCVNLKDMSSIYS